MNPGALYRYSGDLQFRFCYVDDNGVIQNLTRWRERRSVSKDINPVVLCIEPLELTQNSTSAATWWAQPGVAASASGSWKKAGDEYRSSGKIDGWIFLSGNKRIWISHYDLEEMGF